MPAARRAERAAAARAAPRSAREEGAVQALRLSAPGRRRARRRFAPASARDEQPRLRSSSARDAPAAPPAALEGLWGCARGACYDERGSNTRRAARGRARRQAPALAHARVRPRTRCPRPRPRRRACAASCACSRAGASRSCTRAQRVVLRAYKKGCCGRVPHRAAADGGLRVRAATRCARAARHARRHVVLEGGGYEFDEARSRRSRRARRRARAAAGRDGGAAAPLDALSLSCARSTDMGDKPAHNLGAR